MRVAAHRLRGLACTDHEFEVPLDHAEPDGPQITVFAREVVRAGRERDDLPWLLWLSGGPGNKAPRPTSTGGWLGRALKDYRVLLLDQRGTGRSTPATRQTLPAVGDAPAQAAYLRHFRADSIVRDAECVRRELLGDATWSVLGQSFGGFCAVTYLSLAPRGLAAAYVTGGLPPLDGPPDDVYRHTYRRTEEKNAAFFARFPEDRGRVTAVVEHLRTHDPRLPTGERLTPRRFLTVGIQLGTRAGFDPLHYLLEEAFVDGPDGPVLGDAFLAGVQQIVSFGERPLYAAVHESIYCQGDTGSRWAAARVRDEFPQFAVDAGQPLLTGEMIYPFMFDEDPSLSPLREAAHLLAGSAGWPALYDAAQLAANEVPCAAAIYYDDMFVAREHSIPTARAIRGLRTWITNEYEHDGVRESGEVFDRLLSMVRGER